MPDGRFRVSVFYGLLALALLLPPLDHAVAQGISCDHHLKPVPGGVGYARRAEGQRCEGLYQSTVSSVRLQLVSVLKGKLEFDPERHQILNVTAPEVPGTENRPVRVRAVALPLKTYYRMDAVLPRGGALKWPLQDIIERIQLSADNIGVYGWVHDKEGRLFVPLSVTAGDDVAAGTGTEPVRIIVRSAVDLARLVWRTADEDGQVLDQQEYATAPLRAGHPIVLTLAAGNTAVLKVDIAGLPLQSDRWAKLRLRVLRPGE